MLRCLSSTVNKHMRIIRTELANYSWCVELALKPPWDWHPMLERWLDRRDAEGKRTYLSWVDMDSRCVYLAFATEAEASRFATYAALLGIER